MHEHAVLNAAVPRRDNAEDALLQYFERLALGRGAAAGVASRLSR